MTRDDDTRPIFVFHPALLVITDLMPSAFVTAMAAVPLLGLPVKWALHPADWPPDMPLVVIWLLSGVLLARFIVAPMVATWMRDRRGERAGLRVAEGEEYLEVAFFVGERPCRVQRFAYADIVGCGVDRFQVTATGGYEARPYVAERGLVRAEIRTPIPLSVQSDRRALSPAQSLAIAADLDRVIRRHCPLPEPEISLAELAAREHDEMMRAAEKRMRRRKE